MLYALLMAGNKLIEGSNIDTIVISAPTSPAYLREQSYTSDKTTTNNISVRGGTHNWANNRVCNTLCLANCISTTAVGIACNSSIKSELYMKDCVVRANLTGGANQDSATYIENMSVHFDGLSFDTTSRVLVGCGYIRYIAGNTVANAHAYFGKIAHTNYIYAGGYVYGGGSPYTGAVKQHIENLDIEIDGATTNRFYCRGNIRNYGHFTATNINAVMRSGVIGTLLLGAAAESNSVSEIEHGSLLVTGGTIERICLGGSDSGGTAQDIIKQNATLTISGNPLVQYIFMGGLNAACYNRGTATVTINTPLALITFAATASSGQEHIDGITTLNVNEVLTASYLEPPQVINLSKQGQLDIEHEITLGSKRTILNILDAKDRIDSAVLISGCSYTDNTYWVNTFDFQLDGTEYVPELISSSEEENRYSLGNKILISTKTRLSIE